MRVFTCQQCEYSSSGSDVSVNAVIIPQNWGAIPFFGASPLRRYCPPIPRNDDRIHRYILPRTTVFPHYLQNLLPIMHQCSFGVIIVSMENWDISSNFCGLLRKNEILKGVILHFCCRLKDTSLFTIANLNFVLRTSSNNYVMTKFEC